MSRHKILWVISLLVSTIFLFPNLSLSAQERRTALVIGNSNYKTAPLRNPANDARDMAKVLKDLGFEVVWKVNAGRQEMDAAVEKFYRNLNDARVGFFYYAGHGMQVDGSNYLLPVDIQVESSADIKYRSVKADWILAKMEDSGSKVNIVVLDACRDNPFRGLRGSGSGLAPIQSVRGSFIAYATSPGSVARDGAGRNGMYTTHLLKNIKRSGLTVEEVFREVRKGVAQSTNYKQIPWDSSSLMGAFYMAGRGSEGNDEERRRFEQEQARLEKERQELEQAKAEFERKRQKSQSQEVQVASLPKRPSYTRPASTSNVIKQDGIYVAYANGIVRDTKTGLDWKAGPDRNTDWNETRSWVQSLNLDGDGWRMPTMDELEGIYKKGMGSHNITPLLKATSGKYLWVWSGETKGSSDARYFGFAYGSTNWSFRSYSFNVRAFAVRSRSDG
jgi:hypothetical protein